MLLFCIPYAGGSVSAYRGWEQALPSAAVRPLELPARGTRAGESPCDQLDPLVDELADEIAKTASGSPYALFGHSLGAILAFETARLMRDRQASPAHLFVSGHRAPHLPLREQAIHPLDDAAFSRRLRELGGTPEWVLNEPELMNYLMPALRADFTVSERYSYRAGRPLECPITVLGGAADPDVGVGDLHPWDKHTIARCRVRIFPGGHFFLHTADPAVLEQLEHELATCAKGYRTIAPS